MTGSAPTLRRSMFVLGGVLVSVALVAAAVLVLITTVLNHEMSRVAAEDLMTAFGDEELRARAESLGRLLMEKPLSLDALRSAVRRLVR